MVDREEGVIIGGLAGLLVLLIALVIVGMNHGEFPGELARIEQLRRDVQHVDIRSNEDVLGQVTVYNQTIAQMQRYNRLWWAGWAIPDGWDGVQLIEIPVAEGK